MQGKEPALASFLHSTILAHRTLEHSMAFILANKLSSRTLLGTQLMRMVQDAYERDHVRADSVWPWHIAACTGDATMTLQCLLLRCMQLTAPALLWQPASAVNLCCSADHSIDVADDFGGGHGGPAGRV